MLSEEDNRDLQAIQHGSEAEQQRAYKKWKGQAQFLAYLRHLLKNSNLHGSEHHFDELRQLALIGFWRHIAQGKFRGECSLLTFIRRIAHNRWVDLLRREGRHPTEALPPPDVLEKLAEPAAELHFLSQEREQQLRRLLENWGTKAGKCLQIFEAKFAGKTYEQIEGELQLTPGSARKRYFDCLRRWQKFRDDHPDPADF